MEIEPEEQAWRRRSAGSLAWFTRMASKRSESTALTPAVVDEIRSLRERIRKSEGGGGMCHVVSEDLELKRGWSRFSVGYLGRDGAMICASHYVNVLGDGTIVDATADQFGEGHDVRVVAAGDPEYGRYRPEFFEDYNPDIEPVALAAWLPDWKGVIDFDAQDAIDGERGPAWWLEDPTPRLDFLRSQLELMELGTDSAIWRERTEDEIEGIEGRLHGAGPKP